MSTGTTHTITAPPPVAPERMHGGRPVLTPRPDHSWESRVVLNPAAVLVEGDDELAHLLSTWGALPPEARKRLQDAGGACVMLYRAQGEVEPDKRHAPSYLGLALLTPTLELAYRHDEPIITPDAKFHNLGVEDPRCTNVDNTYYLYYTGYSAPHPDAAPEDRHIQICLATTETFRAWTLHGPVAGDLNVVPNKNAALLPAPVAGRWVLLHRPMEGPHAMTIHWATADDPAGPWTSQGPLMESRSYREFERSWIGAGGPPLALGDQRFLMIYHQGHFTNAGDREYDLAAALLDFSTTPIVRGRIEPLMRPASENELRGDRDLGVDNVLFTCANYRMDGTVIIPYAGADSRIFGASIEEHVLVEALASQS